MDFLSFKRDLIKRATPIESLDEMCAVWPYDKGVEFVLISSSLKMGTTGIHIWKTLSNQLYRINPCAFWDLWEGEQADFFIVNVSPPLLSHAWQKMGQGLTLHCHSHTEIFVRWCFWKFISTWSKKINYRNIITGFPLSKFAGGDGFESPRPE